MALIQIPRVTLHRSSLANAARIIKLNMVDQGVPQLVVDDIPTLVPHHKAVSLFFVKVAAAMTATGITHYPYKASVQYYRNDINQALQAIRFNLWTEGGMPLPGQAPVQITEIPDQVWDDTDVINWDTSVYWAGAPTGYAITSMPAEMTLDPVTGIITGTVDAAVESFNPIMTATNTIGSTEANVFNISKNAV